MTMHKICFCIPATVWSAHQWTILYQWLLLLYTPLHNCIRYVAKIAIVCITHSQPLTLSVLLRMTDSICIVASGNAT
ncbi:hypothetical protein BDF19DRAFT_454139 [Syncephalis fuscata]|nr:hypothetical protein BDF19DRAFT_454139 [Syncephalis fuscata]